MYVYIYIYAYYDITIPIIISIITLQDGLDFVQSLLQVNPGHRLTADQAYVPTYLHTCIPTCLPTYLHTPIPTYLHTYIPTLRTFIPAYLHTYIPTLHTYIPTYLRYVPSYLPTCSDEPLTMELEAVSIVTPRTPLG